MSSGQKRIRLNTRERVVSTDLERLQAFVASDRAEWLRHLVLAEATEEASAGAAEVVAASSPVGGPLVARVVAGLRARPEVGTANLFVTPGVLLAADPDASPNPDDSPGKVIVDPGVTLAGQLVFTPPGGVPGDRRVDVIECARSEQVLEADNRDLFDPATGLFTPQLQDKVIAGRLSYRIRLGALNGGFPGTATGWLPLAVAASPGNATTWDQATVWDVRPLLQDAWHRNAVQDTFNHFGRRYMLVTTEGGGLGALGTAEGQLGFWRAGGMLPGTINLLDAPTFQEPGFAFSSFGLYHLYLLQPFGLPRWVRYQDAPAERRPAALRGIPVLSSKGPLGLTSEPSVAVALPTGLGLGGSTTNGLLVVSGNADVASNPNPVVLEAGEARVVDSTADAIDVTPVAVTADTATYDFVPNTHSPANATALWLAFAPALTAAVAGDYNVTARVRALASDNTTVLWFEHRTMPLTVQGVQSFNWRFTQWVPLWPPLPGGGNQVRRVTLQLASAGPAPVAFTLTPSTCFVFGWRVAL